MGTGLPLFSIKNSGFVNLADIMIITADTGKKVIAVDLFTGSFGHIGNHYGVIVGTGSLDEHFLENWRIKVADFQQFELGGHAEEMFKQRKNAHSGDGIAESADKGDFNIINDIAYAEFVKQSYGNHKQGIDNTEQKSAFQKISSFLHVFCGKHGQHALSQ
jgi:hypothetical protein